MLYSHLKVFRPKHMIKTARFNWLLPRHRQKGKVKTMVIANIFLRIVLPVQVAFLNLITVNNGNMLKAKPQGTFSHDTTYTCTTKEYLIILDDALFSFAHIEPVSTVSSFHNEIIVFGKSRCNKVYILYTKV